MQQFSSAKLLRRTIAPLLFVIALVAAFGGSGSAQTNSKIANRQLQEWRTFTPEKLGFSIDLPQAPEETVMPFNTEALENLGVKFKFYKLEQTGANYYVVYSQAPVNASKISDLNEHVSQFFDAYEAALRNSNKFVVLSSKNSSANRIIEREIIMQAEATVSKAKIYFVNGCYYGLQLTTPDTQQMPAEIAKIYQIESNKFFNSFKILDNKKQR